MSDSSSRATRVGPNPRPQHSRQLSENTGLSHGHQPPPKQLNKQLSRGNSNRIIDRSPSLNRQLSTLSQSNNPYEEDRQRIENIEKKLDSLLSYITMSVNKDSSNQNPLQNVLKPIDKQEQGDKEMNRSLQININNINSINQNGEEDGEIKSNLHVNTSFPLSTLPETPRGQSSSKEEDNFNDRFINNMEPLSGGVQSITHSVGASIEFSMEDDDDVSIDGYGSETDESEFETDDLDIESASQMKVMSALGEIVEDNDAEVVICESDVGMINPKEYFRMSWDLGIIMPLLIYLTIVMPFRMCFANEAVKFSSMYWLEFMIDMVFIMDIFLNFRTGYVIYIDGGGGGAQDSDELIEYDKLRVAIQYIKTWFLLDVISGVPFSLLELIMSSGGSAGNLKSAKALKLLRFLKLGRLLKMDKILSNLDRDTLDIIEDFFQNGSTRSAMVMLKLVGYMAYVCHLMTCGFVLVGRSANKEGVECWLDYELKGPFTAKDTTGGGNVFNIYIAGFYFCSTTMTSVGYGDIIARNNTERIYIIMLEFIGAVIFASIIAAITSVVTSMDLNARKTAEQLDAVASFVAVRQFPENMAKRIRRHFRHFYSLKSAIDESKIFSEMSSSLRREVSAYLINELMGRESVFMTMSPTLWPRLLPLLRPMGFEKDEVVCQQGEECTEMYVVLIGTLVGESVMEPTSSSPSPSPSPGGGNALSLRHQQSQDNYDDFGPRSRHILTGGSVNVLHVLGVWHECVETVKAEVAVESYAVSELDFSGLFTSESDLQAYEKMQRREAMNLKMVPHTAAPTQYGKPLIVEVSVLKLRQPDAMKLPGYPVPTTVNTSFNLSPKQCFQSFSNNKHKNDKNVSGVWVIIDLVDSNGKAYNDLWRHRTEKRDAKARQLVDHHSVEEGETGIDVSDIDFGGEARWTDITANFDLSILRLRVMAGLPGKEQRIASLQIPLHLIEEQAKFSNSEAAGSDVPIPLTPNKHNGVLSPNHSQTSSSSNTPIGSPPSLRGYQSNLQSPRNQGTSVDINDNDDGKNDDQDQDDEEEEKKPIIENYRPLISEKEREYVHECLLENVKQQKELIAERERIKEKEREKFEKEKLHAHPSLSTSSHHTHKKTKQSPMKPPIVPISPSNDLSSMAYLYPRTGEIIGWFDLDTSSSFANQKGGGSGNGLQNLGSGIFNSNEDGIQRLRQPFKRASDSSLLSDGGDSKDGNTSVMSLNSKKKLATKILLKIRVNRPEINEKLRKRKQSQSINQQPIQGSFLRKKSSSRLINRLERINSHSGESMNNHENRRLSRGGSGSKLNNQQQRSGDGMISPSHHNNSGNSLNSENNNRSSRSTSKSMNVITQRKHAEALAQSNRSSDRSPPHSPPQHAKKKSNSTLYRGLNSNNSGGSGDSGSGSSGDNGSGSDNNISHLPTKSVEKLDKEKQHLKDLSLDDSENGISLTQL